MSGDIPDPMPDADVHALFDRLFPQGVTGQDVLDEIAPDGWERSPFIACFRPSNVPMRPDDEVTDLVGCCLWDIFSDNHEVVMPDGRPTIIGSFRQSASLIAEHVAEPGVPRPPYDYMRFYGGTVRLERDADMTPVFAMIFRRLAAIGWDWAYTVPDLYLVPLTFAEPETPSLHAEVEDRMPRDPDRDAPATVRAYRQVYRRDPPGW